MLDWSCSGSLSRYPDVNVHVAENAVQILGSAYILGAEPDHLKHVYDVEARTLEPWQDPPGEVSRHDWQKYLGDRR